MTSFYETLDHRTTRRITTEHPEAAGVWQKQIAPSSRNAKSDNSFSGKSMAVWSTTQVALKTTHNTAAVPSTRARQTPYSILAAVLVTMLVLAAMTSRKAADTSTEAPTMVGATAGLVRPVHQERAQLQLSPTTGPGLATGNPAAVLPISNLHVSAAPAPVFATDIPPNVIPANSLTPMVQQPASFMTTPPN